MKFHVREDRFSTNSDLAIIEKLKCRKEKNLQLYKIGKKTTGSGISISKYLSHQPPAVTENQVQPPAVNENQVQPPAVNENQVQPQAVNENQAQAQGRVSVVVYGQDPR